MSRSPAHLHPGAQGRGVDPLGRTGEGRRIAQPILQAFDLGSGLRVEHYEIAAYRSAIAVANTLGE